MSGFDTNEPSKMGITCFLTLFNKHFLILYLRQALRGSVFGKLMKNQN